MGGELTGGVLGRVDPQGSLLETRVVRRHLVTKGSFYERWPIMVTRFSVTTISPGCTRSGWAGRRSRHR